MPQTPPPPDSPKKEGKGLTARETELLTAVMKNCVADPIVNWSGVVADSSYNNEKTAKEMYRVLKKKLGVTSSSPSKSSPPGGIVKSSPKKIVKDNPIPVAPESPSKRKARDDTFPKTLAESMPVKTVQQELKKMHENKKVPVREKVRKEEADAEMGVFGQPEDVDTV